MGGGDDDGDGGGGGGGVVASDFADCLSVHDNFGAVDHIALHLMTDHTL